MKKVALTLLICIATINSFGQFAGKEKLVKAYYEGFEKHDWNMVSGQLADGFTFTSPNNDNHISIQKFREKCWSTNKYIKKVNLLQMTASGDQLFLLVEIITTDNKVVRNIDLYTFNAGKIKSIEVFFGKGESYPGRK